MNHTITLTSEQVALLLEGMDLHIQLARRSRWPLSRVQPYIDLMMDVDAQTIERHAETNSLEIKS